MAHVSLGRSAIEFVEDLPAIFPSICNFHFITYGRKPSVTKELDLPRLGTLSGLELVGEHPDAARFISTLLSGIDVDESNSWIKVRADNFTSRFAQLQCESRGKALALCSYCQDSSGEIFHIPMIDFSIEAVDRDYGQFTLMNEALRQIGQVDGILLNSGASYHYCGLRLLTEYRWRQLMATCVLLGPVVDVRYIGHRLRSCTAALRVTDTPDKPNVPRLVARIL